MNGELPKVAWLASMGLCLIPVAYAIRSCYGSKYFLWVAGIPGAIAFLVILIACLRAAGFTWGSRIVDGFLLLFFLFPYVFSPAIVSLIAAIGGVACSVNFLRFHRSVDLGVAIASWSSLGLMLHVRSRLGGFFIHTLFRDM